MFDETAPPGYEDQYLIRREAQERAAAAASTDPAARRAHQDLARRYADRIGARAPVPA